MSYLRDENQDLGKPAGCMNGIFQILDRHHFLTGRRVSSKRLLQGGQHQMEQQYAKTCVLEKVQKENPRISTESAGASFSSSSCSSTFSSLDFRRRIQPGTAASKESQPSSTKALQEVVKESMHREVRSLSIKSYKSDERRGPVMKHIDSPRPLQHSKNEKPKNCMDERLTLPRFSYDGRESREAYKSVMKHKEVPRLSLDSNTRYMRGTDSRLSFLQSNQESGTHNRTSSVVARLMGLEALPDTTTSTDECTTPSMKSCTKEAFLVEQHKQNQVNYSPRVAQSNPASPSSELHSSADPVRKPTTISRFPVEPAPWRQQDSPKRASKTRQAADTCTLHQTSSVYGLIEKRIADLEFKKSGKDLRALKQILEAMQKTTARMENQRGESSELTPRRRCTLEQSSTVQPCSPKQLENIVVAKQAKVMEKVQNLQIRYQRESSAHIQKANNLTPQNRSVKNHGRHLPTADRKELGGAFTTTPCPGRRSGAVSPRLQQNSLTEKGSQSRKNKVKLKYQQLTDHQLSELSGDTKYSNCQGDTTSVVSESNNSIISQSETEVRSLVHSINTNTRLDENLVLTTRERMPAVESAVNMLEQPSPISVLDSSFYCEDSPSPVKKISTVFREDEGPSSNKAEWCLQNLDHLMNCTRLDYSFKYNQKLERMRKSAQELMQLNKEADGTAANHNPAYIYINKILLTSGLLKDSSFISTTDKLFSSPHLINPDMFHVLEQTEVVEEAMNGVVVENSDKLKLDNRIQRKMIFDLVDEILVRKITSSRLLTEGKKQKSPQWLLKEVHSEMDRLSRIPDCKLELLAADMKNEDEDWVTCGGEIPAVVLDIERLIYKEMINEVITGEIMDWPKRHCRKLFIK